MPPDVATDAVSARGIFLLLRSCNVTKCNISLERKPHSCFTPSPLYARKNWTVSITGEYQKLRRWSGAEAEARQQPPAVDAVVAGAVAGTVARHLAAAAGHGHGDGWESRQRAPGCSSGDAGNAGPER